MKLGDLVGESDVLLGIKGESLAEGMAQLLTGRVGGPVDLAAAEALVGRLTAGESGALLRVSLATLIVGIPADEEAEGRVEIGVAIAPLPFGNDPTDPGPRILLAYHSARAGNLGEWGFTKLARVLRTPEVESALLNASAASEILGLEQLMETDLDDVLRVQDVLIPFAHRVYPDTPLAEVIGLMVREGLAAVPVVGENLQVVGMVRAGEALKHAIQRKGQGEEEAGRRLQGTVREVMSRTVMAVSDDHDLLDAARVMANREVAQLPVIRSGEIVGILTRDAVLRALFGGW